ncbi:MAG: response regulator [Chloracidobacterium sp.]|nr:response regulator [Chloracidobacterium sp.]
MRRLLILLAEDDDDLRSLYGYMLLAAGYKVSAVRNGLEAFAEIQVNRPDVIVTDIAMPVLNGLDLIVAIRSHEELADLPIIAITSFGEGIRELALALGATNAIEKPTDLERMRTEIEATVSLSTSATLSSKGGAPSETRETNYTTGSEAGSATIPPLLRRRVEKMDG